MTDQIEFGPNVAETLAWRLLAELIRRHPARLWIQTSTHSLGTEQAFLIDLHATMRTTVGFLGLPGTNASPTASPGPRMNWRTAYDGRDPRDWLRDFELALGLPEASGRLPASTPSSLAIRWIAGLLAAQLGGREAWIAGGAHRWPANLDDDGLVPKDAVWPGQEIKPHPIEPLFVGAAGGGPPIFALSPAGDLWDAHGAVANLSALHRSGTSMSQLLLQTAAAFLP